MTRTEAATGLTVEVLVEQHQIAPIRVVRPAAVRSCERPAAVVVWEECFREARAEFMRNISQVQQVARASGALELEAIAIKVMVTFEGFAEQIIDGEPDRPAPV